ncbi:hypothetical protein, partial [Pseudonocardia abyssalis]
MSGSAVPEPTSDGRRKAAKGAAAKARRSPRPSTRRVHAAARPVNGTTTTADARPAIPTQP